MSMSISDQKKSNYDPNKLLFSGSDVVIKLQNGVKSQGIGKLPCGTRYEILPYDKDPTMRAHSQKWGIDAAKVYQHVLDSFGSRARKIGPEENPIFPEKIGVDILYSFRMYDLCSRGLVVWVRGYDAPWAKSLNHFYDSKTIDNLRKVIMDSLPDAAPSEVGAEPVESKKEVSVARQAQVVTSEGLQEEIAKLLERLKQTNGEISVRRTLDAEGASFFLSGMKSESGSVQKVATIYFT